MKKILILLVFASLISFVSAHTGNDEFDHCSGFCSMMSGIYGVGGMFFGWIFNILAIAVVILLIAWLIKQIQKK